MHFEPRPVTSADHEPLFRLHEAVHRDLFARLAWPSPWNDARQRGYFMPLLRDFEVFVLEDDGDPVASLFLGEQDGDVWIELVEVSPERQRRGLGTAALDWTRDRARAAGKGVLLEVHRRNDAARRLYLREGFTEVDTNETHHFLRHP